MKRKSFTLILLILSFLFCTGFAPEEFSIEDLDEYDYWPDKSKDHAPMSPMWRAAWYDEFDTYYHKSGALKYPDNFMKLVDILKELKK